MSIRQHHRPGGLHSPLGTGYIDDKGFSFCFSGTWDRTARGTVSIMTPDQHAVYGVPYETMRDVVRTVDVLFSGAQPGVERKVAELFYDTGTETPDDRRCIVTNMFSGISGHGATFDEAIADMRSRTPDLSNKAVLTDALDWLANFPTNG